VTHFERHDTVTDHQRSVALKVFLAQFINTGLIVLLVNARTKYDVPTELGILAGQFSSFVARWHTGGLSFTFANRICCILCWGLLLGSAVHSCGHVDCHHNVGKHRCASSEFPYQETSRALPPKAGRNPRDASANRQGTASMHRKDHSLT
jgi:hypothetical protein